MKTHAWLGLALFAFAGCAYASSVADNAAAEKQIRAALTHWIDATNNGDHKTALEVWAPDMLGWARDGTFDSYRLEAKHAQAPVRPPQTVYVLRIDEVIVDGSLAVVRNTRTEIAKQDSGADKLSMVNNYQVWRRQPDKSWKISRWIDGPAFPLSKLPDK